MLHLFSVFLFGILLKFTLYCTTFHLCVIKSPNSIYYERITPLCLLLIDVVTTYYSVFKKYFNLFTRHLGTYFLT